MNHSSAHVTENNYLLISYDVTTDQKDHLIKLDKMIIDPAEDTMGRFRTVSMLF